MFLEKYTFTCCFTSPAFLPEFKGSTLRGGFGLALKKISCALKHQRCDSCLLFATCAYAFIFEMDKSTRRPHPYVIIPPDIQQRSFKKNDRFTFEIILFGKASNYLPHIVYAVQEMGRNGLGKGHGDRGQFAVKAISQGEKIIFAGEQLKTGSPLQHLELSESSVFLDNRLTIRCLTPLRLKYCNELRDSLPFHLLIRAALRRISSLEAAYGEGEPNIDYKGLAARATKVEVERAQCRWHEIKRYSNRQRQAMMIGGIRGEISYRGEEIAEFIPLLSYCQQTHLGKQTSFGLGRIAVETGEKQ